jgi:hypothetical protein
MAHERLISDLNWSVESAVCVPPLLISAFKSEQRAIIRPRLDSVEIEYLIQRVKFWDARSRGPYARVQVPPEEFFDGA